MVVTTIYVTRHGVSSLNIPYHLLLSAYTRTVLQFRANWTLNPVTGTYRSHIPSPTNLPSDPPLVAYGVQQSHQLATALARVETPRISYIYCSPFYRCLQTIQPLVDRLGGKMEIRGDNGLGYVLLLLSPHSGLAVRLSGDTALFGMGETAALINLSYV
jgi:broad specificity phosphatase PhoE